VTLRGSKGRASTGVASLVPSTSVRPTPQRTTNASSPAGATAMLSKHLARHTCGETTDNRAHRSRRSGRAILPARHVLRLLPLVICSCANHSVYLWNKSGHHVEASRGTTDKGVVICRGEMCPVDSKFLGRGPLLLKSYGVAELWRYPKLPPPGSLPSSYTRWETGILPWPKSCCLLLNPSGHLYLLPRSGRTWRLKGYAAEQPEGFPIKPLRNTHNGPAN